MKTARIIVILLAVVFLGMQFFRPAKNLGVPDPSKDISAAIGVPANVGAILRESCYDCHSNCTRYPWYARIMPAGWFLAGHINDAKKRLNFSEFADRTPGRQDRALEEIAEQLEEGEMPLPSYLLMHGAAALSDEQKKVMHDWVRASRASLKGKFTAESGEGRGD